MDAAKILSQLGKTYSEAQSYRDEGSLTVTRGEAEKPGLSINFKTHFKRPNFFKFETAQQTKSSTNKYIIWCDGKTVARQSNQLVQQLSEHFLFKNTMKDLDRALATIQEAQPTAHLLFDKLTGRSICELPNVNLVGEEVCEGQNCFHLQSKEPDHLYDIWISSLSFGIAKIVERQMVTDNQDTLKVGSIGQRSRKIAVVSEFNYHAVAINDTFPNALFQIPAQEKS